MEKLKVWEALTFSVLLVKEEEKDLAEILNVSGITLEPCENLQIYFIVYFFLVSAFTENLIIMLCKSLLCSVLK